MLKFLQNLQENISAGVYKKKKWLREEKEEGKKVFFREIYQNTNFEECLQTAAITKMFCGWVPL